MNATASPTTALETQPFALPKPKSEGSPLVSEVPTAVAAGHPMDSARILMAMTALARRGGRTDAGGGLESIVSKPVLKTLLSALQFRDVRLMRHSRQVAVLTVGMAQQLGWEGRQLVVLETAALLHDIAKIAIPDSVLRKPGKLSVEEADFIARHHDIACNLLQALRVDPEVINLILQSHSYFNGSLDGSSGIGSNMAQGARILSVADAYESLTSDQAFRVAKTHDEAMAILREGAGSRFDGSVVSALDRWAGGRGLNYLMEQADVMIPVQDTAPFSSVAAAEAGTLCHIFSYLHSLETLYDGFYVLDSDLRFVVWSGGAEALLGRTATEMLGEPYSRELLSHGEGSETLAESECPVRQAVTTGQSACRSVRLRTAGDEWLSVDLQSIPLFDNAGKLAGVAQIFVGVDTAKEDGRYRDLKAAANRDPLTGIANRGQLESQLEGLFEAVRKAGRRPAAEDLFSVMFLDLDHFKEINDTFGHGVGDRVLIDLAELLSVELYSGEFVARYGGEEFVIVCPGTTQEEAVVKAERLRKLIANQSFNEPRLRVTASVGVAEVQRGDTAETLFARADSALFRAKRGGRNRVEQHSDDAPREGGSSRDDSGEFLYRQDMEVCTQADLIVHKMSAFIDEQKADLREVGTENVRLWLGRGRMFQKWGRLYSEQPIDVHLRIPPFREGRGASKFVLVEVTVRPRGRGYSRQQFDERARHLVEALRSYLVAR